MAAHPTEDPTESGAAQDATAPAAELASGEPGSPSPGIIVRHEPASSALVVTKRVAGFDRELADAVFALLRDVTSGRYGALKFLAFEFAGGPVNAARSDRSLHNLATSVADLVLDAPIVTIAAARGYMRGLDLDLALACNMVIADPRAIFDFRSDSVGSVDIFDLLKPRVGFGHAERLMARDAPLSADEMHELLLVREVLDLGEGTEAVDEFLHRAFRRHNASYGIYRAQRIAARSVYDQFASWIARDNSIGKRGSVSQKQTVSADGGGERGGDGGDSKSRVIDANLHVEDFSPGATATLTVCLRMPSSVARGHWQGTAAFEAGLGPVRFQLETQGFSVVSEPPAAIDVPEDRDSALVAFELAIGNEPDKWLHIIATQWSAPLEVDRFMEGH